MNKFFAVILISVALRCPFAYSTDYYFANSGDDNLNNGLSATTPFRTITKLNSLRLNPGDRVFLKRGDAFFGQVNINYSGTASAYITFDAFGTGANPVLSGAVGVNGTWKQYSGNVYVADVSNINAVISQVFVNGKLMTLARYPDSGFLNIDASSDNYTVTSKALTQAAGYWNGANVIARTERWVYENRTVSNYSSGTLKLATPSSYTFKTGWGFFLNNSFKALNAPGEWYHDVQAKKLYLITPTQVNPNNVLVTASMYDYGFNINRQNYISINNLSINGQRLDGIYVSAGSYINISNNNFTNNRRNGIWTGYQSGSNIQIQNNTFSDIGNNGIDVLYTTRAMILGNTLTRIALRPDLGESGDGKFIGIMAGKNATVMSNVLDSIGYNGIHGQNGDTISYNYIQHACLTKDDGGAIYCYKTNNIYIKNNIIVNPVGTGQSSGNKNVTYAHGIYLDDSSSYCNLSYNTVVNGDWGIFVHNTFNSTVLGNVLYNNRMAQLNLQSDRPVKQSVDIKGTIVSKNIFYSLNPDQLNVQLWSYKNDIANFGTFSGNNYVNPYNNGLIKTISAPYFPAGTIQKNQLYDFNSWKAAFGQDADSKTYRPNLGPYYHTVAQSGNMVPNSTIDTKLGWYSWGTSSYTLSVDKVLSIVSGNPALKCAYSSFSYNARGYFAIGNFPVTAGSYYKLRFRAKALKTAGVDFDITQNASPYASGTDNTASFFIKDTTTVEYVFKCTRSFQNGRVMFSTTVYDSTLWLDDITLTKVAVDTNSSMPATNSPIFINATNYIKSYNLVGSYTEVNGTPVTRNSFWLTPYGSRIYIHSSNVATAPLAARLFEDNSVPENNIIIYSVPAKLGDIIYVEYPGTTQEANVSYSIVNTEGKEVLSGKDISDATNRIAIPTNNLTQGVFILKLNSEGSTKTARIVVVD